MFSLLLVKTKRTSEAKIKRQADTGSPWQAPFCKIKVWIIAGTYAYHHYCLED